MDYLLDWFELMAGYALFALAAMNADPRWWIAFVVGVWLFGLLLVIFWIVQLVKAGKRGHWFWFAFMLLLFPPLCALYWLLHLWEPSDPGKATRIEPR